MADKKAFELKASVNHWETMRPDGSGLLTIKEGETYVTADPNEIAALRNALGEGGVLKEVEAPKDARSKSKVTEESK